MRVIVCISNIFLCCVCVCVLLLFIFHECNNNKSFIDRLEVHINTIVKKGAYITLTHTHTHITIIQYVNINIR